MLKKLHPSQINAPDMLLGAILYVILFGLGIYIVIRPSGLWDMASLLVVVPIVIACICCFMALPLIGSQKARSNYYLIDESTGKATLAPRGLYLRSLDGSFRKRGRLLIRVPYTTTTHLMGGWSRVAVAINPPNEPDASYAERLYQFCLAMEAVHHGTAYDIRKAQEPYHDIAQLHASGRG